MRIVVNASTSIGDSLYCAFLYQNLNRLYAHASLQVLCWSPLVDFYESLPYVEQVIPYDQVPKDNAFRLFLLMPPIDIFIDLQHTVDSAALTRALNASVRIGINPFPGTEEAYTSVFKPNKEEHIFDCFTRCFQECWPAQSVDTQFPFFLSSHDRAVVSKLLLSHGVAPEAEYVVLHPGAKGEDKLWPVDHWCALIEHLAARHSAVVLVGSAIKTWGGMPVYDQDICARIHARMPDACVNLAGRTRKFMHLVGVVRGAAMYFGLDTGPTHLAAVLGVPVIELYKFINDETFALWRARGDQVTVIPSTDMRGLSAATVIKTFESMHSARHTSASTITEL